MNENKPSEFSNELYKLIYGNDVNIEEINKFKTHKEVWDDILLFLAKDDITKIDEIKKLPAHQVLSVLNSKLTPIPKAKEEFKPIGFKTSKNNG